jgi:sugar lactone lactonase YvrE
MIFETLASGYRFLEAPRVAANGDLYFTDLVDGGIIKRTPAGTITHWLRERRWIGGLSLNSHGGLVCSGLGGLVLCNENGEHRPLLTSIEGVPIIAVNDIYADDEGSIYGGTVDFLAIERKEAPSPGVLFRLDPPDRLTVLCTDVNVSNGIGLSPDRSLLYHSETSVGVWACEIDSQRRILKRSLFAKMSDSDGLAVDSLGGVWVASLSGGKLVRYRPDGNIDEEIALPVTEAVSLTFAGADMRDLYVVAGGDIYDSLQRRAAVYRARSPVAGQVNPYARF